MIRWLALALVRFYRRFISRLLPPMCRYYPSCSTYALEVLEKKPTFTALVMIAWRLLRCNPMTAGGYDPVEPDPAEPVSVTGGPGSHSVYDDKPLKESNG